jgi:hypothetical protein
MVPGLSDSPQAGTKRSSTFRPRAAAAFPRLATGSEGGGRNVEHRTSNAQHRRSKAEAVGGDEQRTSNIERPTWNVEGRDDQRRRPYGIGLRQDAAATVPRLA